MKAKYDLRKRRLKLGLTLEEVAKKAGITPGAVRSYEVGAIKGKLSTRIKLATALGIPPRALLSKEESMMAFGNARILKKLDPFLKEKGTSAFELWEELRRLEDAGR